MPRRGHKKDLAEWNSPFKPLPSIEEAELGIVPDALTHRDMGRHILTHGGINVPSGETIPVSGTYSIYGPLGLTKKLKKGDIAPFVQDNSHVWILEEKKI